MAGQFELRRQVALPRQSPRLFGHVSRAAWVLVERSKNANGSIVVGAWITGGSWLGLGTAPLNAGWTISGAGDFNGNKADVLWENTTAGRVRTGSRAEAGWASARHL